MSNSFCNELFHDLDFGVYSTTINVGAVEVDADFGGSSRGVLTCSLFSPITTFANSSLSVSSADVDLSCNITGDGDLQFACGSAPLCHMMIGGTNNSHAVAAGYHFSNAELDLLLTTGSLTFGSQYASDNVSDILVDGVVFSFAGSSLTIASPQGSINFVNVSSNVEMTSENASIVLTSARNVSVSSNTTLVLPGSSASISITADSDCSAADSGDDLDSQILISSDASLTIDSTAPLLTMSVPAIDLSGSFNVSEIAMVRVEGESSATLMCDQI